MTTSNHLINAFVTYFNDIVLSYIPFLTYGLIRHYMYLTINRLLNEYYSTLYFIVNRNLIQECYNNIYDYKMDSKNDSPRIYFFLEVEFDPPENFW